MNKYGCIVNVRIELLSDRKLVENCMQIWNSMKYCVALCRVTHIFHQIMRPSNLLNKKKKH
jgi:hypothetical protein